MGTETGVETVIGIGTGIGIDTEERLGGTRLGTGSETGSATGLETWPEGSGTGSGTWTSPGTRDEHPPTQHIKKKRTKIPGAASRKQRNKRKKLRKVKANLTPCTLRKIKVQTTKIHATKTSKLKSIIPNLSGPIT